MRIPNVRSRKLIQVWLWLLVAVSVLSSTAPGHVPTVSAATTSRGYLTTVNELRVIKQRSDAGIEPYKSAVTKVMSSAAKSWSYTPAATEVCTSGGSGNADMPAWNDDGGGTPILYAKALAYGLTGTVSYAQQVRDILQKIMTNVKAIDVNDHQCQLNFSWGTPELVASADLIEDYFSTQTCTGPTSTIYGANTIGSGNCKILFQNWLIKNPYYIASFASENDRNNWGAASTNLVAYIADYTWDRAGAILIHRRSSSNIVYYTPGQAYARAVQLMLDRNNGLLVDSSKTSCDTLTGAYQKGDLAYPVKSQITERGIIPEEARRDQFCNISKYDGVYHNYPQLYINNNLQQCELMLRRGDNRCYTNVATTTQAFSFVGPDGLSHTTTLYAGRGSLLRAINAIVIDSNTQWKHTPALEVAYRYYYSINPSIDATTASTWYTRITGGTRSMCTQGICFGTLTHGFAPGERPGLPPVIAPPF